MVDFKKLRKRQQNPRPIHPEEIFLRLPKSPGLNDLWNGQAEALRLWHERRDEKDNVIKLNTGGGKTLVGLLIGQSILNEERGPVLYLCPTKQLQEQVIEQSQKYGIPTIAYPKNPGLPIEFQAGQAVMIATYHALFNGLSKFGLSGYSQQVQLAGIVFDDAHTAFSNMRNIFSLSIKKQERQDLYHEITVQFREAFEHQNRQGTFDDIINGLENSIVEVPYIAWKNRANEVRQRLAEIAREEFPFVWPLIRDSFEQCHALISKDQFTITPLLPHVDLFPSFTSCPNRIYMSATFADDSSLVRTFDAGFDSVSRPVSPTSLAGVGERMILAPELMPLFEVDYRDLAADLAKEVALSAGVVILSPSKSRAVLWDDVATVVEGDNVSAAVKALKCRSSLDNGPYVFPNRYDGIDLPGDSCRLLIFSGLPKGSNDYDLHTSTVLEGSSTINAALAQKIEQGMGRGTRGGGDHCVVLLLGNELVGWVSRAENLQLLTNTTQAQIKIGVMISNDIDSHDALEKTMNQCLARSSDWTEYHANELADSTVLQPVDKRSLKVATAERKYFRLMRKGYYQKATTTIRDFVGESQDLDPKLKGWLLELGARSAHHSNNATLREELQHEAYSYNKNLHRPSSQIRYVPLGVPTKQTGRIADYLEGFELKQGPLAEFEKIVSNLVPAASSNQFEEALKKLGHMLGFSAERPEKEQNIGPDVLWLLDSCTAWTIEAKSRKQVDSGLRKSEQGQLLQALQWVREQYPAINHFGIVVHPNADATKSVTVGQTMALTLPKLGELVGSVRTLLEELVSETMDRPTLEARCESRLRDLQLCPSQIGKRYLSPFVNAEGAD